ncbi:MAG: hypothetical protein H5T86_12735 [Armatimonadetes bacterium]|nr:hypothetical protein [Armatimonadota bacterium]
MKTRNTLIAAGAVAVAVIVLGCGRRQSAPGTGPGTRATQAESAAPAQARPNNEVLPAKPQSGPPAVPKAKTGAPRQPRQGAAPQPGEPARPHPKPKLSDDQFVELMADLAVALKKISDEKMSSAQGEAELEKVVKKYGLSIEELKTEQEAHDVGTPEQRQALGQRILKRISERIEQAQGKPQRSQPK